MRLFFQKKPHLFKKKSLIVANVLEVGQITTGTVLTYFQGATPGKRLNEKTGKSRNRCRKIEKSMQGER